MEATIIGAESAPPGLAYDPPEAGWTAYGLGIPCIAGAGTTVFYAGPDSRASVHLTLAIDEATAREAIAEAPTAPEVLGITEGARVERDVDGPDDESVHIRGDGVSALPGGVSGSSSSCWCSTPRSPTPSRRPSRPC